MAPRKIPIQRAEQGMLLVEPAVDAKGRTLLGAGRELTPEMLGQLTRHGVHTLVVASEGDGAGSGGGGGDAPLPPAVIDRIERQFAPWGDDPRMKLLESLARRYIPKVPLSLLLDGEEASDGG